MKLEEYLHFMSDNYFYICKNKNVLEIGPNTTIHTDLIIKNNVKTVKLIEPNKSAAKYIKQKISVDIIEDDAMFILTEKHLVDVVVCCGVLYHLHSPLHLLELIVNNCDPEYIILDSVIDQKNISFLVEEDNLSGNRQLRTDWKSSKFNLVAPFDIINLSMENMGYVLVKKDNIRVIDYKSKNGVWVGLWKKEK